MLLDFLNDAIILPFNILKGILIKVLKSILNLDFAKTTTNKKKKVADSSWYLI